MGSVRLLHPRGVAEVGRGQDRVVVETDDRGWCSANREAAASAEATWCVLSLVRRGAQQAPVPARLDDRSDRQRPRRRAVAPAQQQSSREPPPDVCFATRCSRLGRARRDTRVGRAPAASEAERGDRRGSSPPRPSRKPASRGQDCRSSIRMRKLRPPRRPLVAALARRPTRS